MRMSDGFSVESRQSPGGLGLHTIQLGDTIEVVLSGELDLSNAAGLKDQLSRTMEGPANVVVDLRGVTFIDSSGIQALVASKRRCLQCGRQFRIRLGDSQVRRMLTLAGVAEYLGI
jgi:anti-anti-sigma factor